MTRFKRTLPVICILLAAGCWALIGPMSQKSGESAREIAFWRALVGGMCFLIYGGFFERRQLYSVFHGRSRRQWTKTVTTLLLFSIYGVVMYYVAYQIAIQEVGIGLASVLLYTAPFWVAGVDLFKSRKHASVRAQCARVTAGAMCVIGVFVIALNSFGGMSLTGIGLIAGLVSGFCYASYYFLDDLISGPVPRSFVFGIGMLLGAFFMFSQAKLMKSYETWVWLFLIGLVSTFLAYTLFSFANRRLGVTLTAVFATTEPAFAVLIGKHYFGEDMARIQWLGFALVLVAALLATFARAEKASDIKTSHG